MPSFSTRLAKCSFVLQHAKRNYCNRGGEATGWLQFGDIVEISKGWKSQRRHGGRAPSWQRLQLANSGTRRG